MISFTPCQHVDHPSRSQSRFLFSTFFVLIHMYIINTVWIRDKHWSALRDNRHLRALINLVIQFNVFPTKREREKYLRKLCGSLLAAAGRACKSWTQPRLSAFVAHFALLQPQVCRRATCSGFFRLYNTVIQRVPRDIHNKLTIRTSNDVWRKIQEAIFSVN